MAPAKKQPAKPKVPACCMTCAHSQLLQWGNDPIIAECAPKHSREVARPIRACDFHELAKHLPKPIRHLEKKTGITKNSLEWNY